MDTHLFNISLSKAGQRSEIVVKSCENINMHKQEN